MGLGHKENGVYHNLVIKYFKQHDFGSLIEIRDWIKDLPIREGSTRMRSNIPTWGCIKVMGLKCGCECIHLERGDIYNRIRMNGHSTSVLFKPGLGGGFISKIIQKRGDGR